MLKTLMHTIIFRKMEGQLLREKNILPTTEVLENVLGESYSAFNELMGIITNPEFGLVPQWNYYNDGKAWLCKVSYKKKTVFWLSVWDGYFKIGFYFTEKNSSGVLKMDIEEKIKEEFIQRESIGKLMPLAISVSNKEQIADVIKVIEYKKSLK
jgi:hypothetical protein